MENSQLVNILNDWRIRINDINHIKFSELCRKTQAKNGWFTEESIRLAFRGINRFLDPKKLSKWINGNSALRQNPKEVGIVMAGNIPIVGFHDMLCTVVTGHTAQIKLSSQDDVLIPYIVNLLFDISSEFSDRIRFVNKLKSPQAIIATGSNNSSRYFEYYFSSVPHIIRKNRTSVGILSGNESKDELYGLGQDILQYFGLGCRNISKLLVPEKYDFRLFYDTIEPLQPVVLHHKYANNYDYNKSILLINTLNFLDNGFLLIHESNQLVSPISVVFYETYKSGKALLSYLDQNKKSIQCVVSGDDHVPGSIPFGSTQTPELWDYSDNVNTLEFLLGLHQN